MKTPYSLSNHKGWLLFLLLILVTTIGLAQTYTWTGGDSQNPTDWTDPDNWTGASGTPGTNSTVIIPDTDNDPVIASNEEITISELIVESGGMLTISRDGILNVEKTVNGATANCIKNEGTILNQGVINLTENGATTSGAALLNNGIFQNDSEGGNLANTGDLNIMDVSGGV